MFARVVSHPQGKDSVNIPLSGDGRLSKETLCSQFPGAVGLKYQIDQCWSAVPVQNDHFIVPQGDPLLVVVANTADARQILSGSSKSQVSLVSQVSKILKNENTRFQPRTTAPYSCDSRGNVRIQARNQGKKKQPKIFTKTYKVVFVKDVDLPIIFSQNYVLTEGIFILSSLDDERTIKSNLLAIIKNCTELSQSSLTESDLTIVSFASKQLSLPCLSDGFEWDGERLRANIGQGKLYVLVTHREVSSIESTVDTHQGSSCSTVGAQPEASACSSMSAAPVATASLSNATTPLATSASSSNVITDTLSASSESDLQDFQLVQPKRKRPLRRAALRFRQTLGSTYSHQQTGQTSGENALSVETNPIEVIDSEDEELQQVLEESLLSCTEKTPSKMGDIQTLLKTFQGKINKFDKQEIIVFRKRVLDSAFRALKRPSFDVQCKLYVKFSGELGLDHGGPRREFFRLAIHELSANPSLFTGTDENKIFTHNLSALEQGQYRMAGKLVAMSLAQEGPAMGFLNKEVFMLMAGLDPQLQDFDLTLIPDADVRHILEELCNVDSMGSRDAFLSKNGEWMIDQGIHNAWHLKITDIPITIHALVKQTIYHRTASEIDQFCKGLNDVCGLMTDIKKDPKAWQTIFCDMGMPLSKEKFLEECDINFSAEGSNKRNREEETVYSFEVFLQDIEEKTVPVTFGELLAFTTGADKIPPCGFESKIQIMFYDQEEGTVRLPYVSTCALNFNLPRNTNPEKLKELLLRALKESLGFEKC